jgi:hypothetical protein
MPKSGDLPGALDDIRQELDAAGIPDMDSLWKEIGGGNKGLDDFSRSSLIPRQALIGRLVSHAAGRGKEKGASWPRRHTFDLLLLATFALFGWLALRAAPRAQPVGIALRDLPAGERVSACDLHGRYRLSLRVERTDINRFSEVPIRASLAVSSPGGKTGNPQTRVLRNIPIVAVDRAGGDSTVTVALQESELESILPLLPDAKVWVVQPYS